MHQVNVILRIILVVLICVTEAVSKTDYLETLLVEDHLICKHHSVILDVDGTKQVPALYFAASTKGFSEIRIRRAEMNPYSCGFDRSNEFGKAAVFCCKDVGQELYIELTAVNAKGDRKHCMIKVDVFTGGTLNVDQCLPNITVTCDFPIDIHNLSNFGKFVKEEHLQQPIIINGLPVGMDGLVQFKCSTDPIIAKKIQINEVVDVEETAGCGQGYTINRTMQLTDRGGVMSECVQVITVSADETPLGYHDILWPADTTIFGCADAVDLEPILLGEPNTYAADCERVLVNYQDELLLSQDVGCTKIIRRWSVIDWCAYEYNGKREGKWDHVQVIEIANNIKPEIHDCDDVTICVNEDSCEAVLNYSIQATDDCHPDKDLHYTYNLFLDGDDDNGRSGRSQTVTEYLPVGEHILHWSVSDGCNNSQQCSHRVTVSDCKAPSIFCITGFSGTLADHGLDEGPVLEIWASDFVNKAFDNCTPVEELVISLSEDSLDQVIFYDCSHLGLNDIEIFVTDPDGQQSSCRTTFLIQDNANLCSENEGNDGEENGLAARIEGQVAAPSGMPISDVRLTITGTKMTDDVATNDAGTYQFENVPMLDDYKITASKSDVSLDGISVVDLVLLQQHILGFNLLDSPYRIIAGDINNSGHVSASDLVELKSFLIRKSDSFASNEAWRFIDEEFTFIDPSQPWPFTDAVDISNLDKTAMVKNFIGIKIGDIDQSIASANETRSDNTISAQIDHEENSQVVAGWSGDVYATHLSWTSETFDNITFNSKEIGPDDLSITKSGKQYQYNLILYKPMGELIDLSIIKIKSNERFTNLEAKAVLDDFTEVDILFSSMLTPSHQLTAYPNPFSSDFYIDLQSHKKQLVDIYVINANGQLVHKQNESLEVGDNEIRIDQTNAIPMGLLYVRVVFSDGSVNVERLIKSD